MNVEYIGIPIIFIKTSRVLIGIRKNSFWSGLYGLPGGRVAPQETLKQCLIREAKEEVGVIPTEFAQIGVVKEWQKTHFFLHFVYVCTKWRGKIENMEPEKSESWQWCSLDNLPENILLGHKAGIHMLLTQQQLFQIVEI